MHLWKKSYKIGVMFILFLIVSYATASRTFNLDNYSQDVDFWLPPNNAKYNQPMLLPAYQDARLTQLKHLYFGTDNNDHSPWSKTYVSYLLKGHNNLSIYFYENNYLRTFDNKSRLKEKLGYNADGMLHKDSWILAIANNTNVEQFKNLTYNQANRAIASNNTAMRILPTNDAFFLNSKIPGEGYPFDMLQSTAIYAGTPLYIIGTTKDKSWDLVLSPDCIGWVDAAFVAHTDNKFIKIWQKYAYHKLAGITSMSVSINGDKDNYFKGYVGMMFPVDKSSKDSTQVLVPVRDGVGYAMIYKSTLDNNNVAILPLSATPKNFARVLNALKGKPYGWGNLEFNNDCSSELKALFSLFGIYLPRNSSNQYLAGKLVDLSARTLTDRLLYLMQYGTPLLTLMHIKGHMMLYVGTFKSKDNILFPLSYQQMWGLSPKDRSRRDVIGRSVFLPLLSTYPEDPEVSPQAAASTFELIYLNASPIEAIDQGLSELFN